MTPEEYVTEIVVPTVREFLEATDDPRRGYLAAITTHHVRDYLMRANVPPGATWEQRKTELKAIDDAMKARNKAEYEVVEGIANGTKHCGRDGGVHRFTPGDEKRFGIFGFGPGYAGFDEGRWDIPGLQVQHVGSGYFMDICIKTVLTDFRAGHLQHLGGVALGF